MRTEPHIENRPERPYVGIAAAVSMQEESEAIARHLGELRQWLDSHQLHAAGAPFVRYRRIEMPHRLEIEVALPLASATAGDADVIADSLPAGRYAVLVHNGPVQELVAANALLQAWARQQGIRFDTDETGQASVWRCRTETMLTDPRAEPDPRQHRTEIAYLMR